MTRYEQELRKLFDGSGLMDRPQYSGRVCVGELGKDLRVRAEFFSAHIADQYDAIRLTVLNRKEGVVDRTLLQFKDVWGKKPVPGNPYYFQISFGISILKEFPRRYYIKQIMFIRWQCYHMDKQCACIMINFPFYPARFFTD